MNPCATDQLIRVNGIRSAFGIEFGPTHLELY